MLNRRHLRIKILQALYAYFQTPGERFMERAEKELFFSIDKMYDMYILLLLLLEELRLVAEIKNEEGKNKKLPTEEDLNPNTRFSENKLIMLLQDNEELQRKTKNRKLSWAKDRDVVRKLFRFLQSTREYSQFMESTDDSFEAHRDGVVRMFKRQLVNHELLSTYFEERSIFWIDDLDLVASMIIKTLKKMEEGKGAENELLPLYRDTEDELTFIKTLFRKTIVHRDQHIKSIEKIASNWEVERIALIDTILMQMALTEVREFDQIPVKVTLNEYIEIAKYYSTPKSSNFINGILDRLFQDMESAGEIRKTGRGLID
jgi:N utilization substance protein B